MKHREVEPEAAGRRLDAWLAAVEPGLSRSRGQALIRAGRVTVDGRAAKPNQPLRGGERVEWPEPAEGAAAPERPGPEALPLDIRYEDGDLLVLNKPPGQVVHPAPGHAGGTLVNALLHHCPGLAGAGDAERPGIVHRLDKDTSGLLVVAKHPRSLEALQARFKAREVEKEYRALVWGTPDPPAGVIEAPIGRSRHDRKKMSVDGSGARAARSGYRVLEAFPACSLLAVRLHTGRTHQIRVHCSHIGHPVVGDPVYGRRKAPPLPRPADRQMLHAARLAFAHPVTGAAMDLEAGLPDDMQELLHVLRAEAKENAP